MPLLGRRFRLPKAVRKMKLGRAALGIASHVVPGGGLVRAGMNSAIGKRAARAVAKGQDIRKYAAAHRGARTGVNAAIRGAIGNVPFIGGAAGRAMDRARAGGGGMSRGEEEAILAGEASYRRPRMNPGNIHALRRSMRRIESFAKLAKKTIQFVHHTKLKSTRKARR